MTELITMHTHSTFCNHAKDPLDGMVQAAVDAGIAHMAATEHYPIPDELDPSKRSTMPIERLGAYIDAVREQQKRDDIDVLLGCELDWLGEDETRSLHASDFDQFDIVLGSVHFVDRWLMEPLCRTVVPGREKRHAVHGHVPCRRGEEVQPEARIRP